ncbi:Signal transduction response regulator, receiver domain [Dillenia turbinata]|uniref:histidine kinase n=1 Tax=Dillenia turbinata TaxID=194707 RepID=A0AAN8UKW0_9MAGN
MEVWKFKNKVIEKRNFNFCVLMSLVLVKMSWNCKPSGSNGGLTTNLKLKKAVEAKSLSNSRRKWKRKLFNLWLLSLVIGFIWFLWGLSDGFGRRSVKETNLSEEKAQILVGKFNLSKNQLHALASVFSQMDQGASLECYEGSVLSGKASNHGVTCALKVLCSEKQAHEILHNVEAEDHCLIHDEVTAEKLDRSLLEDRSISFLSQSLIPSTVMKHQKNEKTSVRGRPSNESCNTFPLCMVKFYWWISVGIIMSCKMSSFQIKFWKNRKPRLVWRCPQLQQQQSQQLQQKHALSTSRGTGNWRRKLLVIFVVSGIVGSLWLFWYLKVDFILRRKETLANMCDERARMLQDQFNVSMNHVHALAILVSTFHHGKDPSAIDQKTFGEYTERTAFERPLTSGVAYALKVPHSEREHFEKKHGTIKKMEYEDQTLVQDCTLENLEPAPIQDEYAPVIFSQDTVSHIVSIDMMSGKEDRENILRARASGKGVLTAPFKLLKSNHLGVVLTFAVYNTELPLDATPEQRIGATVGYLGASYDIPSLVEKLLHQLASKQTIVVNVYDTTNLSSPINMYGEEVTDTGLLHISSLDFGDPARKHEMHCRFKHKTPPPWTAIIASLGLLVITLLVGHIFHAAINRIAKVEDDYRKMMELKVRAEAADVAKSQFLATVSHEIRTPMNGVLGMLKMLMDTDLDATQKDYAQTAHACGKDLIYLMNEVLDQAKIESGRLELEHVPFDLRSVLDNVLSLFSVKSHEKGIELAVYISDKVPKVVIGDPGRFRQIITNLVGNSIKFTEKGHIFISVHLADEVRSPHDVSDEMLRQGLYLVQNEFNDASNTLSGFRVVNRWKSWENFKNITCPFSSEATQTIKLLVTVEDTGVGIPHDAQGRIFMPFMQADSSTSRTYGGTGIGLSISRCLVDLMGGEIGFVSEPHIGSTFSFTASFAKGEMSSPDTAWQQYDLAVQDFRGMSALVVDGKSIRAEVTRYHLQRLGISVDIVSSMTAVSTYLSTPYNTSTFANLSMILVDNEFWDDETGLAFHCHLKEFWLKESEKASQSLPKIFLLTTSISLSERIELKSAGFVDDVLTKPLRLNVLMACFRVAFGIGKKRLVNKGKPSALGSLLKGKRMLVVDDNAVNQRVAEGALKKYGAIVSRVESGKAALKMLEPPHNFDACFMDLRMPEMDGFEATRQIRYLESKYAEQVESGETSLERFPNVYYWHTPILAMTADVFQNTEKECVDCGMDGYVSKPFEEEQLYSAVAPFFESD